MRYPLFVFLTLAAAFFSGLPVLLAQTANLSLQGVLVQDNGQAAPDSNYQLSFKLWKSATSTAPADLVWSDVFNSVKVVGGKYNVILGSGAPLTAPFNQAYYLGVSIGAGTGPELMPRPRLTAAPAGLALLGSSNEFTSDGPVNIGTTTPAASARLLLNATSKGILIPRMTDAQKKAIAQPDEALLVYQTDQMKGFYYYDGSRWQHITNGVRQVGELYGGGIIFYVDAKGQHGLIAALTNQPLSPWGCSGKVIINARGTARGCGDANTASIVDSCATAGIAARVCDDLVLNGYSDWFLPNKDELNLMYTNLKLAGLGGFSNASYLSSSEVDALQAWGQTFSSGVQGPVQKANSNFVRAIRRF
ncbi:MAG: DUF1566 domain-containing protein [Saprospiraceae bacterium]|nr:DUF1566 domain-containing protein [Saprospiraceae bacterium]